MGYFFICTGEKPFWPKYAEYEIMPAQKIEEDKWADFKNPYAKDNGDGKK